MKLFTKTLLFFISVIIFQSSLTILLITNITKRSNLEDARQELRKEANLVFENYNAWKRGIWKNLISLQADEQIAALVQQSPHDPLFPTTLANYLKGQLTRAGIDLFVLKDASHPGLDIVPITYNNFALADVQPLENTKPHPYIELRMIGSQLCLIGVTRLPAQDNPALDLFSIKRIDREFCQQLILNRNVHAVFFLDQQYLSGTLAEDALPDLLNLLTINASYDEIINPDLNRSTYHLALQKLETLRVAGEDHTLVLMTMFSNLPYLNQIRVLERIVLSVTALSALFTILLSLFFSRNITQPVKNLLAAMQRIRSGAYNTSLDIHARNEIGELFQGFNEMSQKLHEDKLQLENYIHEITTLSEYNEKILHSIGAGIIILNPQMAVEKVNTSFVEDFHLHEIDIVGQPIQLVYPDLFDRDTMASVQAILHGVLPEERTIKRAKQQVFELNFYPILHPDDPNVGANGVAGCVCIIEDISRKVEFEEKIFQAEKLSSISMLSAGVAHEINNPLGSIMTNVQNLIAEETDAEKKVSLGWIEQETRRIAKIVRELLDFASTDRDRMPGADVNAVIRESLALLKHAVKRSQRIAIPVDLTDGLPHISMSKDELKQIIINLVQNAIHAIPGQGEIRLSTTRDPQQQRICLTIADTGVGIPPEHLPRIFDPFYTTKPTGEGTGLGLSVVYGLISKYHGTITVNSTAGQGTQVHCLLPALSDE